MGKTFHRHTCTFCQKSISACGLGKASHYRSHVLEGLCVEMEDAYIGGALHWIPRGSQQPLSSRLSVWQRKNMTSLAEQFINPRKPSNK